MDLFSREQHRRIETLSDENEFCPGFYKLLNNKIFFRLSLKDSFLGFSIDPVKLKNLTRGPLGAELDANGLLDPSNSKNLLEQLTDERKKLNKNYK